MELGNYDILGKAFDIIVYPKDRLVGHGNLRVSIKLLTVYGIGGEALGWGEVKVGWGEVGGNQIDMQLEGHLVN